MGTEDMTTPNQKALDSLDAAREAVADALDESDRYHSDREALKKLLENVLTGHSADHGMCCCAEIRVVLSGLKP
jgi:hypothetical protein